MRAYSLDLRECVLAAVDGGMPRTDVLTTFHISRGTLQRWLKRRADGLPLAGRTGPGRNVAIPDSVLDQLRAQLDAFPDATLVEHLARWNATHAPVSRSTIARGGWTHKKRRSTPVSKTPSCAPPSPSA